MPKPSDTRNEGGAALRLSFGARPRVKKGEYIGVGKGAVYDWREISLLIDEIGTAPTQTVRVRQQFHAVFAPLPLLNSIPKLLFLRGQPG